MRQPPASTPADTREKLIRSAIEVFSEKGYDGTRLGEVAKRCGMTTGAVYSRFGSKEDLLSEAVWEASGRPIDEFMYDGVGAPAGPVARIRALLGRIFQLPHRELHVEAMVAARRSERFREVLSRSGKLRIDRMHTILDEAARAGELEPGLDGEAVGYLVLAILSGVALLDVAGTPRPSEDAWREVVGRVLDALYAQGRTAADYEEQ